MTMNLWVISKIVSISISILDLVLLYNLISEALLKNALY
jgi:hypothetical protein